MNQGEKGKGPVRRTRKGWIKSVFKKRRGSLAFKWNGGENRGGKKNTLLYRRRGGKLYDQSEMKGGREIPLIIPNRGGKARG